jgi:hypothetical protein
VARPANTFWAVDRARRPFRDGRRSALGRGEVVGLHLSQIDEADELLTNDPLALLIGMVLNQEIGQTRNRFGDGASTGLA